MPIGITLVIIVAEIVSLIVIAAQLNYAMLGVPYESREVKPCVTACRASAVIISIAALKAVYDIWGMQADSRLYWARDFLEHGGSDQSFIFIATVILAISAVISWLLSRHSETCDKPFQLVCSITMCGGAVYMSAQLILAKMASSIVH